MNPSLQIIKLNLFLKSKVAALIKKESRGDVPGWVLVVLMTTALVTGIWSIAAPKLTTILRMFQLIFMQFNVMTDTNLSQGELAKIAINGESGDYQRYPLIGGGSLLVADRQQDTKKFIDFGNLSSRKVLAIAVDEDESN